MNICIVAILVVVGVHLSFGQSERRVNVDSLFSVARELAFAGQRDSARILLNRALEVSPNYTDILIFIARTLAWDRKFDEARETLQQVFIQDSRNYDAYAVAIDLEVWDGKYEEALIHCERALQVYPTDEYFLLKKANILHALHRDTEALLVVSILEKINRAHPETEKLRHDIAGSSLSQEILVNGTVDAYSQYFAPFQLFFLQYNALLNFGTISARANYRIRSNTSGVQGELEAYPKVTDGVYAYLNYGFAGASSVLFPVHRVGVEVFFKMPSNLESSLGGRLLTFTSGSDVSLYTGSIGYYYKDFWFSLRPFLTTKNVSLSRSFSFSTRWYYSGTAEEFLTGRIGTGFSPDERSYDPVADRVYYLKAQSFGLWWQKPIDDYSVLTLIFDVINQELTFKRGEYVTVYSISVGYRYKF